MALSKFLKSRKKRMISLINDLGKSFSYASVLGVDVKHKIISADKGNESINEGRDSQAGFVIKLNDGASVLEYSLDDLGSNIAKISAKIKEELNITNKLKELEIKIGALDNEKLVKSFKRPSDFNKYSDEELLNYVVGLKDTILKKDDHIINVSVSIQTQDISKIFVSKDKELDQNYTWVNGIIMMVYRGDNGKVVMSRDGAYSNKLKDVLKALPMLVDKLIDKSKHLTLAKPIVPGEYEVITDPSITGLIAHEAFGHGVEMDQFVKDRALAKKYVNDYVASPIVNMRDGANSAFSVASYFFDDDGILAKDTQIIKNGILVSGICDMTSAAELKVLPTGNGRRESYKRKAYTRMTNTFFEPGSDKLKDMIKSVKHGYMLFETNNGMEDPKNWAIQCVCEYGIEIVDGKLTDNYVSPVVMSGYVPDLLKSITAVSNEFKIIGSGSCGKGYKEWVRVSDGGAHLKAKVKLS